MAHTYQPLCLYVDLVAAADWPIATPPVKLRRELSLAEWVDSSECGLLVEPKKKKQTVMKRQAVQLAACVCVDEMMWEGNFQQSHYYSMLLLQCLQLERESANVEGQRRDCGHMASWNGDSFQRQSAAKADCFWTFCYWLFPYRMREIDVN